MEKRAERREEQEAPSPEGTSGLGFKEFVTLMAALMAINAISIDAMLPVLPQIGEGLGITSENQQQWIVTSYLLGFGGAQLIYGPLADRFGRKPILLIGLGIYAVFTVIAMFASSLPVMITARALQGTGAAATRVLAITIIRDRYSGRRMARVMSLIFIVFLAAPVIAPSIGQAIAFVAPWQWIFGALAVFSIVTAAWAGWRLPESLHATDRRPMSLNSITQALRLVFTNRFAVGYMLGSTAMLGALFGFINSAQQIFAEALGAPELFTTIFALAAGCMALASFVNSRIVERIGMRRVSHAALFGFIAFACGHVLTTFFGHETVWIFAVLQAGMMFCFGLVGANFNSMAMEPLGSIAGTGSSVLGFFTTVGGALIGFSIGQQFDGTTLPLALGYISCSFVALFIVLITEGGRLFRPAHSPS